MVPHERELAEEVPGAPDSTVTVGATTVGSGVVPRGAGRAENEAAALPARYEDLGAIAGGSFGEVRRVQDTLLERVVVDFECPHGIPWDTDVERGRFAQAITRARAAAHGALSVLRTSLGVGLLPRAEVEARLDVCRRCPGGLAVMRGDDVHTCGKLLEVHREQGRSTCGCLLRRKAVDAEEDCPNGWWPRPEQA